MANKATPTGNERFFGEDEIIVSKTDLTGRIIYANDVFCTIASYTEEEVIGKPHSMIRHPDMPRAVFKLLWDTIASGREIFAYVMNMAKNGDHYWVLAHVTPSFDSNGNVIGYHSNRRTPDRGKLATIQKLYKILLEEERRHSDKRRGLEASMALLEKALGEKQMPYEQFIWHV
jgi:PAS domain S-box-containing protein